MDKNSANNNLTKVFDLSSDANHWHSQILDFMDEIKSGDVIVFPIPAGSNDPIVDWLKGEVSKARGNDLYETVRFIYAEDMPPVLM